MVLVEYINLGDYVIFRDISSIFDLLTNLLSLVLNVDKTVPRFPNSYVILHKGSSFNHLTKRQFMMQKLDYKSKSI